MTQTRALPAAVQSRTTRVAVPGAELEVALLSIAGGAGAARAPLVFLHEGLGSVAMWRDWPAEVCAATGRSGVVYSRRGYGDSSPVSDVRGAGRLAPDYLHGEAQRVLPALLSALGIERPVLIGHSDGGSIALLHASQHPVTAAVVLAPHVMVEDVSVHAIRMARAAFESGELRARLARFHADVDGAFWQWNDVWLSAGFRSFDIRAELAAITAPLLAIQGLDDAYGTLEQIRAIRRAAPQTELLELPGCGHSAHRDAPAVVTQAIARFLAPL